MTRHSNRRQRQQAGRINKDVVVSEESRRVLLLVNAAAVDDELLSGCPVAIKQEASAAAALQLSTEAASLKLQLDSWVQLDDVLAWFVKAVMSVDPTARLSFAACLPKECRADVHTLVAKKHSKTCESVSEGFGEDRHVAVVAKGAVKAQRPTSEQTDHALALWYLYKQQQRQQSQQQQQQQHPEPDTVVQATGAATAALAGRLAGSVSQLSDKVTSTVQVGGAGTPGTIAGGPDESSDARPREYSRDEVAQMLIHDKLPDDLAALWNGPLGEAQRQMRLLCLAASAGDLENVEELIAAHPGLASSHVRDLSSGGQLPLHLAAAAGEADIIKVLIAAGADVKATNANGETALQVAQRCEQCDCEAVLLQAGSENKQQDSWHDFNDL